ncbi:hypothetical protein KZ287_27770, partial [Escherichia coli]|nr:hypothetical protein [Escherichia coli]
CIRSYSTGYFFLLLSSYKLKINKCKRYLIKIRVINTQTPEYLYIKIQLGGLIDLLMLETAKQIVKHVYPFVCVNRHDIFKGDVTSLQLSKYLDLHPAHVPYVTATIIYLLEADGYVSKPLI